MCLKECGFSGMNNVNPPSPLIWPLYTLAASTGRGFIGASSQQLRGRITCASRSGSLFCWKTLALSLLVAQKLIILPLGKHTAVFLEKKK